MTATPYRSEFLRIMDDFSSDSCDANELIERVKSLQDADDNICYYDVDDTFWTTTTHDDVVAATATDAEIAPPADLHHSTSNDFEDVLQNVHLSLCDDDDLAFASCVVGPALSSNDELDLTDFGSAAMDTADSDDVAKTDALSDKDVLQDDEDAGGVWWGEVDEQGLLDSIDHRAICDKSNRFQWPATCLTSKKEEEGSARPPVPVTPPPRNEVADSSTRMVNHILASCLKKRKLHVPYKHNVKLINFSPTKVASSSFDGVNLDMDLDDDDFTIRPTTAADPILMPPPALGLIHVPSATSTSSMVQLSSQTPTMSKARDVQHMRVGIIQPNAAKDKKIDSNLHQARKQLPTHGKMKASTAGGQDQLKRKHSLLSLGSGAPGNPSFPNLAFGMSSEDDEDESYDMMVVDQDILDLGNSITASMSRIVRPKQECLPLPDFGNMPQDLRELKLKIEATECKVEGTKHRHRKGGPCPRCQVQNQLRAAKRALLCRMKRYK